MSCLSWAELPERLILLLLRRTVGLAAYVRLGAVCRSWHSLSSANECYKPVPWLMLSETPGTDVRQFYDLSTNEVYKIPLPQGQGKKILGSAHGWLITVGEDGHFHLLNPLNGSQISLPPKSTFQSVRQYPEEFTPQEVRDLFTVRATLSSDPASGDFVVMVINLGFNTTCLSFYRSVDKQWSRFKNLGHLGISYANGQFYSITNHGKILACEVNPQSSVTEIVALRIAYGSWSYYVVECAGKLLIVSRSRVFVDDNRALEDIPLDGTWHYTDSFKIYELDLKERSLVEIKSIGDYTLFVGFNNAICLPAPKEIKAYKRNCIYFLDDYHDAIFRLAEAEGGLDMGVFSLDDMSIEPHYPGTSKSNFSLPIWVMPTF